MTPFRSHRKCVTSLMVQKRKKNVDSIAVTDHRTRASLETESECERKTAIKNRKNDDSLRMTRVSSKISVLFLLLLRRREERTRSLYKDLFCLEKNGNFNDLCFGIWIKNCNYYQDNCCTKWTINEIKQDNFSPASSRNQKFVWRTTGNLNLI